MKKITLLAALFVSAATQAQEVLRISLTDPSKASNVSLSMVHGSIDVTGYNGKEVIISVEDDTKVNAYKPTTREDGLVRINSNKGFELRAEEENNNVKIYSSSPNQKINVKIQVPVNSNLKMGTVNGPVKIGKVSGLIEAKSVNGKIEMKDISGTVSANTVNGSVEVHFTKIDKSPMAFSTINGNIELSLPATAAAQLKMKSDRGDIYSDFDIKLENSSPGLNVVSEDGMKKISKDGYTVGSINGGGPELFLKNMHGDLIIRKK